MKKAFAILASTLAFCAAASSSTLATRHWVASQLAALGIHISEATVRHDTNGTFTVTSPFSCASVPDAVAISLTFAEGSITPRTPSLRAWAMRNRPLKAATESGGTLTTTVYSGYYENSRGKKVYFDFPPDGLVLESAEQLPPMPPSEHVCELDDSCNCIGCLLSPDDVEIPLEYTDPTKESLPAWFDILDWIDTGTWQPQRTKTDRNGNEYTVYYFECTDPETGDTYLVDVLDVNASDAWVDAITTTLTATKDYLEECRDAYRTSQICDKSNPQHAWHTATCGANSWSVCANNPDHTEGTEAHGPARLASRTETTTGWTELYSCPCGRTGYTKTHVHHFTNCGVCDAGDGCTAVCTGCGGHHIFGSPSGEACAKCECPVCTDCNAHPDDISLHTGWTPCSEDVEDDNFDGTASGAHCQCQCHMFGHNTGTPHDYQPVSGAAAYEYLDDTHHLHVWGRCTRCDKWRKTKEEHNYQPVSGAAEYEDFDDTSHLHHVGICSMCSKIKNTLEPHNFPAAPDSYGTGTEAACPWIFHCSDCNREKKEIHAHDFDEGEASVETYGGVTRIVVTYTCRNCGYSYDDETVKPCYHREVILENGSVTGFGDSLWHDCECSNCHTNRAHSFTIEIKQPGACSLWQCSNENGDGTLCSATTNMLAGAHAGWIDLGDDGHQCFCGLKTESHARETVQGEFECIAITKCPDPPDGCGRELSLTHTPEYRLCGTNIFCAACGRMRVVADGAETWQDAGLDAHTWGGKPEAERTSCLCDCGLAVSHYFAPDRTTCACECGESFEHIPGSPACYCTGEPGHAKVFIAHGPIEYSATPSTNVCSACGGIYTNNLVAATCTVCSETVSSTLQRGTHVCTTGFETAAGEVEFSWSSYAYVSDGNIVTVDAGSRTGQWGGGAYSAEPPGPGSGAASSLRATGAYLVVPAAGRYKLRAKIDDTGSVSVGPLTAAGGSTWSEWGEWVEGYLSAGTLAVSACAVSPAERGHICGFEYELVPSPVPE